MPGEYDELRVALERRMSGQNLKIVAGGLDPNHNPGQAIKDLETGKRAGLPREIVASDRPRAEHIARQKEFKPEEAGPGVKAWMARPDNLAISAQEDLTVAQELERYTNDLAGVMRAGVLAGSGFLPDLNVLQRMYYHSAEAIQKGKDTLAASRLLHEDKAGDVGLDELGRIELQRLQGRPQNEFGLGLFGKTPGMILEQGAGIMGEIALEAGKGAAKGGVGGAAVGAAAGGLFMGPPGILLGAKAGGVAGMKFGGFMGGARASVYSGVAEVWDSVKDLPVDRDSKKMVADAFGMASGALEFASARVAFKTLPAVTNALEGLMRNKARELLQSRTFLQALQWIGLRAARTGVAEGGTEYLQGWLPVLGKAALTLDEGLDINTLHYDIDGPDGVSIRLYGAEALYAEGMVNSIEGAKQGAHIGAVLGGAGSVVTVLNDQRAAIKQARIQNPLARMIRIARQSNLPDDKLRELAQEILDAPDTMTVDGDKFIELLQDGVEGMTDAEVLEALSHVGGDFERQIGEAAGLGTDVEIPFEDYLVLARTDLGIALSPYVSPEEGAMSASKAMEYLNRTLPQRGELAELSEEEKAEQDLEDEILTQREAQIRKEWPGLEAKLYAQLDLAHVRTEAARAGVGLQEWIDRFSTGARVQAVFEEDLEPVAEGGAELFQPLATDTARAPFFSKLGRTIEGKLPGKGTGNSYLATIRGWAKKGMFKLDELEWSGLEEWLSTLGKEKVTKEQVEAFFASGGVRVEEERALGRDAKFSEYTLPGDKENYRETVLMLTDELDREYWHLVEIKGERPRTDKEDARLVEVREARDRLMAEAGQFRGGHFDEPNVVAHFRSDTRDNGDTFFIEEIQSDWHQKGRTEGYGGFDEEGIKGWSAKKINLIIRGDKIPYWIVVDETGEGVSNVKESLAGSASQAIRVAARLQGKGRVPDAPFKGNAWPMLAFKHALAAAVEMGAKRIAWTTGEQQAARYELSNYIDDLVWTTGAQFADAGMKKIEFSSAQFDAEIEVNDDGVIQDVQGAETDWEGKNLADVLGKEPAQQILDADSGSLGDITIGGEGMKSFYDKMLPNLVNKYVKKWGGKVGEHELGSYVSGYIEGEGHHYIDGETVHSVEITDEMRDAVQQGQELFQPAEGPSPTDVERGAFRQFNNDPDLKNTVIRFTEARDRSTYLHEGGHLWLAQMQRNAEGEFSNEGFRRDWAAVRKKLGIPEGGSPTGGKDGQHERFAEMVELWLMEGKSPSLALERVFQKFAEWLLEIYHSFDNKHFKYQLDPEIRGVMERLVATDAEIMEAKAARAAEPLFSEEEMSTWNEQDRNAVLGAFARANDAERDRMRNIVSASTRQRASEKWEQLRQAMEAEVADELTQTPLWQAHQFLTRGELMGEAVGGEGLEVAKLSRDAVRQDFGKEALAQLGKATRYGLIQAKGGYHPDDLAAYFGFEATETASAAQVMLDELGSTGNGSGPRTLKDAVKRTTDERMTEEHGEFETSEAMEAAVSEAITSPESIEALLIEARKLARQMGGKVAPQSVLRRLAHEQIQGMKISQVRPNRYRSASQRAGLAAVEAYSRGDLEAALIYRTQQTMNMLLENEGRRAVESALKEQKNAAELLKKSSPRRARIVRAGQVKINDEPTISYIDRIDHILHRFDFRRGAAQIQRGEQRAAERVRGAHVEGPLLVDDALGAWIAQQEGSGQATKIGENVRSGNWNPPWNEMTVAEFTEVVSAIANIEHLAKRKVQFMEGQEHRSIQKVQGEILKSTSLALENIAPWTRDDSHWMTNVRDGFSSIDATMIKMENHFVRLDGGGTDGPLMTYAWRPILEARGREAEMEADVTAKLSEALHKLMEGRAGEMREVKEYPELFVQGASGTKGRYSRLEFIAAGLNWGNMSNRFRLLDGYGWDEKTFFGIMDQVLEKEDWAFIMEGRSIINSLWDQIAEQERKLTGVVPTKIEGVEIETRHGTIPAANGYYFVAYDPKRSRAVALREEKNELFSAESNAFKPMTPKNHTMERSELKEADPLLLDLELIPGHLSRVIHDLTHREPIMRIDTILQSPEIHELIKERIGSSYSEIFRPWLQHIAGDRATEQLSEKVWGKYMRMVRGNYNVYVLGLRATTLAMQAIGHSNAIGLLRIPVKDGGLGKDWRGAWWHGTQESFGKPTFSHQRELFEQISARSSFMRERITNIDRDNRLVMQRYIKGVAKDDASWRKVMQKSAEVKRDSMGLIGVMQLYSVDIPIWRAAYEGAITTLGKSEMEAGHYADSIVSRSQGGGAAMDLSAVQRHGEAFKAMTMFFSYVNTRHNQMRDAYIRLNTGGSYSEFAYATFFALTLDFVLSSLIRQVITGREHLPTDDEDNWTLNPAIWAKWLAFGTASEAISGVPFLRDLSGFVSSLGGSGKHYGARTPVMALVESSMRISSKVGAEEFNEKDFVFAVLDFTAAATGMPGQPIDIAERSLDWIEEWE